MLSMVLSNSVSNHFVVNVMQQSHISSILHLPLRLSKGLSTEKSLYCSLPVAMIARYRECTYRYQYWYYQQHSSTCTV